MENMLDRLGQPDANDNPALAQKREEMIGNTEKYVIQPGDTIANIARNQGIDNYDDLVALNRLLGNDLRPRNSKGTNILIKAGQEIHVPKDREKFKQDIASIRRISEAIATNEKIAKGDRSALKKEINERIFPKRPQSLGVPNVLAGFINAQKLSMDPILPRIVDPRMEKDASCSHFAKMFLAHSMNPEDLKPAEKKLLMKQNIDAWMFPKEVMDIGYVQKMNLMGSFDPSRIGQNDPIDPEKAEAYRQDIIRLGKYLENGGVPGSFMPIYFKHSKYKGVVASHNSDIRDKHYNTHMSIYAGNADLKFPAYEIGEIKDGQIVAFGNDKKPIQNEIARLTAELGKEESTVEKQKQAIREAIDIEQNLDLKKQMGTIDGIVEKQYVRNLSPAKQDEMRSAVMAVLATENAQEIKTRLSALIHYPVSDESANWLLSLYSRKKKAIDGLKKIEETLSGKASGEPVTFDAEAYGNVIRANTQVQAAFAKYNAAVKAVRDIGERIRQQKSALESFQKETATKEQESKKATAAIAQIEKELAKEKTSYEGAKRTLLDAVDPEKNHELKAKIGFLESRLLVLSNGDKDRAESFMQALRKKDTAMLMGKFRQSEKDCEYLFSLLATKNKAETAIESIRHDLGIQNDAAGRVDLKGLGSILSGNKTVAESVRAYNESVERGNALKSDIAKNNEKLKTKKELPVSEYLANFMQSRADHTTFSAGGRKVLLDGMKKYSSLIHLKANGKAIDLAKELELPRDKQTKITESDAIEISGPMMIDGLHMNNSGPERKERMNARTRFFFEFVAADVFLPSELLEPGADSTFRKAKFDRLSDQLKLRGVYDLRRGMTLEEVLKRQIPIFEKDAFAKLDPEAKGYQAKHDTLIARYYGLQIKALEMMGFIENEDRLNPGATNINRTIPYYDTATISKTFTAYVGKVKQERLAANKEKAPYIEYVSLQMLPGDTHASLFGRMAAYLKDHEGQFGKYPNLRYVGQFNDYLKKEFMERYVQSAIKSHESLTWHDLQSGKVKPGEKLILHLSHANEIAGELMNVSYTPSLNRELREVDRQIIDLTVPVEQNRNLVKKTLIVESYVQESDSWFKPAGMRRGMKKFLEGTPMLHSFGDFQLRIQTLRNGWSDEWPTKAQLTRALKTIEDPKVSAFLADYTKSHPGNSPIIVQDIASAKRLALLAEKADLGPKDFHMLTDGLLGLLRLDDGSGSNVIGKLIGAPLLSDKLNGHFEKANGILEKSGENMETLRDDRTKSEMLEKTILLINNMGEKKVLFGLTENYILRIVDKLGLVQKENGTDMKTPELQTKYFTGSIEYGLDTFISHMKNVLDPIALSNKKFQAHGSVQDLHILNRLIEFNTRIFEISNEPDRRKRDIQTVEAIFGLLSDKDFRSTLEGYAYDKKNPTARVSTSLLPTPDEIEGNAFRNVFFNYVRKGERAVQQADRKSHENVTTAQADTVDVFSMPL